MSKKLIDRMVARFLGWKLPQDFGPDCGISFTPFHPNGTTRFEPVGTNLLTADQARQMFEHVIGDALTSLQCTSLEQEDVLAAVIGERCYQDKKWGTLGEHPHEVGSWLTIMRQLLTDAERAYMSQRGDLGALDELRKVVAVGVACMEQHGVPSRFRTGQEPPINLEGYREAGSALAG